MFENPRRGRQARNSNLRKHPFLLALRRWGSFARNAPSGEERGETDVLAGYICSDNSRSQIVFRTDIFRKLTLGAPDSGASRKVKKRESGNLYNLVLFVWLRCFS